jgi:polysaccharide export outer membrane protein
MHTAHARRAPWIAALLVAATAACSSTGRSLPPAAEIAALTAEPPERAEYRLHVGDRLQVKFTYQPDENREVPVRPDGKIRLGLTGEITAEGLTARELAAVVEKAAARRLRDPHVVVVVTGFGERRVYVGGEVQRPGFVIVQGDMTPLQAVLACGGFDDGAAPESTLYVLPVRDGGYRATRLDLEDVVKNGTPETIRLAGNEVLWVPRSRIGNANEFVQLYVRNMIPIETRAGFSYPIIP